MVDWKQQRIYLALMSKEQLTEAVMALPLAERISLAQELWESIEGTDGSAGRDEEREALAEAQRRDAEMSAGAVMGRTHEQVMESMRRASGCT
jgi:putative addiction module component (TIGR02574 family)